MNRERALKKRNCFRARSAPVTGVYAHKAYPNIAKTTQQHQLFAKIPIYGTIYYVFVNKMFLKFVGVSRGLNLKKSTFRSLHVPPYLMKRSSTGGQVGMSREGHMGGRICSFWNLCPSFVLVFRWNFA